MENNNRIEEKLDKVVDSISDINVTLAKQSVILDEHVKRTNLLEAKVEPIQRHVTMVNGVVKFIGLIGIFIGIIEGFLKIMGY